MAGIFPGQDRYALWRSDFRFHETHRACYHVIVVFSDKYLRSPYCMTELHSIYQRSVGDKEDFLRRIIPLVLDDDDSAPGVKTR